MPCPIPFVVLLAIFSLAAAEQPSEKPADKPADKPAPTTRPATRPASRPTKFNDVDVKTFDEMRAARDTVVLDVRTREEYDAGHIPGAVLIDATEPDFAQQVARLDKQKTYLVHCGTGRRSVMACNKMGDAGFTRLHNLLGGMRAWRQAGKEVAKDEQGGK